MLLVGGSGFVGTMVVPFLKQEHAIRVLDVVPPQDGSVEYVDGSALDPAAVALAVDGMEAVVYMALGRKTGGGYAFDDTDLNYDLNVKGLHRVLHGAAAAGVRRAVYAGTMSVHDRPPSGVYDTEDIPLNSSVVYGFTKGLGEHVCEWFARVHGLTAVVLRLYMPVARDEWHRKHPPSAPQAWTASPDVASAISLAATAALSGFHAVFISGDWEGKIVNCARAKALLGWEPLERPRPAVAPGGEGGTP